MLTIKKTQIEQIEQTRLSELKGRIGVWLDESSPHWQSMDSEERASQLEKMMAAAQAADMQVEVDFAVFCQVFLGRKEDFDVLIIQPTIAKLLESDLKPSAKLTRLQVLLEQSIPEVPSAEHYA